MTENLVDSVLKVDFVPEPPLASVDAPRLTPKERRDLLLAINATRAGAAIVTAAFTYDKQTDDEERIGGEDYVQVAGFNGTHHLGAITCARIGKKIKRLYIRIADHFRSDGEKIGFTTMLPRGIKTFQLLSMRPGPLALEPETVVALESSDVKEAAK